VPDAAHSRNADSLELGHFLFGWAIRKHLLQISKLQEVHDQFPFLSFDCLRDDFLRTASHSALGHLSKSGSLSISNDYRYLENFLKVSASNTFLAISFDMISLHSYSRHFSFPMLQSLIKVSR
jgi:hypothetical protein